MKTIIEAAKEFSFENTYCTDREIRSKERGFIAGVEFAQSFIPIARELPPPHTKILVIDSISNSESYGQFSLNMEWFHCHKSTNVFAKSDITHWRPINLK